MSDRLSFAALMALAVLAVLGLFVIGVTAFFSPGSPGSNAPPAKPSLPALPTSGPSFIPAPTDNHPPSITPVPAGEPQVAPGPSPLPIPPATPTRPPGSWERHYGGRCHDEARSVIEADDGGYVLAGCTFKVSSGKSDSDFYVVKTDRDGNELWAKQYGGEQYDCAHDVQQAADGGYVIAGGTESYSGSRDVCLFKINSDGDLQWLKTYGSNGRDEGYALRKTADGGYLVGGTTNSRGDDDMYAVKTDRDGNLLWSRTFGGSEADDGATAVIPSVDGGYVIAGYSRPTPGYRWNARLVKMDVAGSEQWDRTYGLFVGDCRVEATQAYDWGYALACTSGDAGHALLIKTDWPGSPEWQKSYYTEVASYLTAVNMTTDGGYVLAGNGFSNESGSWDGFMLKTDYRGVPEWYYTVGGPAEESIAAVQPLRSGGYVMAGYTRPSGTDGDFYLVKIAGP